MAQKDDDKEYYNKVFGTGGGDWDWGQPSHSALWKKQGR